VKKKERFKHPSKKQLFHRKRFQAVGLLCRMLGSAKYLLDEPGYYGNFGNVLTESEKTDLRIARNALENLKKGWKKNEVWLKEEIER